MPQTAMRAAHHDFARRNEHELHADRVGLLHGRFLGTPTSSLARGLIASQFSQFLFGNNEAPQPVGDFGIARQEVFALDGRAAIDLLEVLMQSCLNPRVWRFCVLRLIGHCRYPVQKINAPVAGISLMTNFIVAPRGGALLHRADCRPGHAASRLLSRCLP
jgi:hypothetical protein